jgi:hypothetical protein
VEKSLPAKGRTSAPLVQASGTLTLLYCQLPASLVVEANLALGRIGQWFEQGLELLPDNTQSLVVLQQGLVDFSQPLEDFRIGGQLLAHLHKRPHHKYTHCHRFRAV